jgi:hypothetical protein
MNFEKRDIHTRRSLQICGVWHHQMSGRQEGIDATQPTPRREAAACGGPAGAGAGARDDEDGRAVGVALPTVPQMMQGLAVTVPRSRRKGHSKPAPASVTDELSAMATVGTCSNETVAVKLRSAAGGSVAAAVAAAVVVVVVWLASGCLFRLSPLQRSVLLAALLVLAMGEFPLLTPSWASSSSSETSLLLPPGPVQLAPTRPRRPPQRRPRPPRQLGAAYQPARTGPTARRMAVRSLLPILLAPTWVTVVPTVVALPRSSSSPAPPETSLSTSSSSSMMGVRRPFRRHPSSSWWGTIPPRTRQGGGLEMSLNGCSSGRRHFGASRGRIGQQLQLQLQQHLAKHMISCGGHGGRARRGFAGDGSGCSRLILSSSRRKEDADDGVDLGRTNDEDAVSEATATTVIPAGPVNRWVIRPCQYSGA